MTLKTCFYRNSVIRSVLTCICSVFLLFTVLLQPAKATDPDDEVITLPVRIHFIDSGIQSLQSQLLESEVETIFETVNEIWSRAGIQWEIESFVRKSAINEQVLEEVPGGTGGSELLQEVIPFENLSENYWNIFFVNRIGESYGLFLTEVPVIIQSEYDHEGLFGTEGGMALILAHELGHSLDLAHVPCPEEGNLMAAGCFFGERDNLTEIQIEVAREQALKGKPFAGRDIPFGPVAFLLSYSDELGLEHNQKERLITLNNLFLDAITPLIDEAESIISRGVQQQQSGTINMEQSRDRRRKLQQLQYELTDMVSEYLVIAFTELNDSQVREADHLLEKQSVRMGMGS